MITVSDVSLNFSGQNLFTHVNLQFTPGNCYGVIGANGAGKSTFLRILSGDLEPSSGEVAIDPKTRMSVLRQDHFAYDDQTVLDTILQGNPRLFEIMQQKDALYAKEDFSEEDGVLASELEGEFAELNGWEAETEAGRILQGLGLSQDLLYEPMGGLADRDKVKNPAGQGPVRPARHHPARRTHQPSGYGLHRLAGGFPDGLYRHRHRRLS